MSASHLRRAALASAALLAAPLLGAGCREAQEPPVAAQSPLADSADQVIFGARQLLTNRGLLRAELHADTAFFFNEGTRIELRNVNTTFFNATGAKNGTLTSVEGTYNTQLGQMAARRNVVVVSEDGRRLTTPELRFNEQTNLISSDSAFTASQGTRQLTGVGFESDPNMTAVRCKAACRGELGPVNVPQTGPAPAGPSAFPAAGSRPNTFVLPGQNVAAPTAPTTPAGSGTPRATPAGAPPAGAPPAAPTTSPPPPPAGAPAPAPAPTADSVPRPAATPPEVRS